MSPFNVSQSNLISKVDDYGALNKPLQIYVSVTAISSFIEHEIHYVI
jgi:hypothetical protein